MKGRLAALALCVALLFPCILSAGFPAPGSPCEPRATCMITFPLGGGSDSSFHIQAPRGSVVTKTCLRLEGQAVVPPAQNKKYIFSDTRYNIAYFGETAGFPPAGAPEAYMDNVFSAAGYSDVTVEDGSAVGFWTTQGNIPYHMFKFKIAEDVIGQFTVKWVGTGWDRGQHLTIMDVYIFKQGAWESFGSYGAVGDPGGYSTYSGLSQSNCNKYVDSNGWMYVLALGPEGLNCVIATDYVDVSLTGSTSSYPTDLRLDMGDDGSDERVVPGRLDTAISITEVELKAPLQALIDGAAPGQGMLDIPFRFTSSAGGKLSIVSAEFTFDAPPMFTPVPADRRHLDEDTTALRLLDLNEYFKDDIDAGKLGFAVTPRFSDDKVRAIVDTDGHSLGFRANAKNWYGTREFMVRATDSKGLSVTGFLNITVDPVNDPPVLELIPDQTAPEDQQFVYTVKASDVDDSRSNLTFSDNTPLFDIDPSSGLIMLTPSNSQVGQYYIQITVEDRAGASDSRNFTLTVQNTNDAPVIEPVEDMTVNEDAPWELQLNASDVDAGDVLTYLVESDIPGLRADPGTGLIQFTFDDAQVGVHDLNFTATDSSGAFARTTSKLTVVNVEEPPAIEPVGTQSARQGEPFKYQVRASDPDPGDSLSYSVDAKFLKIDSAGLIKCTPSNADVGEHKVKVTVRDGAGQTAETTFRLLVENVNDPPTDVKILSPVNSTQVEERTSIHFSASATDPDIGDAAALAFTWKESGTVIGRGRDFDATPGVGTHVITLEVSDGQLAVSAQTTVVVVQQPSPIRGISMGSFLVALLGVIVLFAVLLAVGLVLRRHYRSKHLRAVHEIRATPVPPEETPMELVTPSALFPPGLEDEDEPPPSKPAGAEAVPTRDKVRHAIMNSKRTIRMGMDEGREMGQAERLLLRAAAASYRKEYAAAIQLAHKAERIARDIVDRDSSSSPSSSSKAEGKLEAAKKAVTDAGAEPEQALPVEDGELPKKPLKGKKEKGGKQLGAKEVRERINEARRTIEDAEEMGADVSEAEQLLEDAISSSYSRNYEIANGLARQAEVVAAERLLRLTEDRDGN